jgi:hypothetical protein
MEGVGLYFGRWIVGKGEGGKVGNSWGIVAIVLKTGPVTEPVRSSVQVFTGRTTGSLVHRLVF